MFKRFKQKFSIALRTGIWPKHVPGDLVFVDNGKVTGIKGTVIRVGISRNELAYSVVVRTASGTDMELFRKADKVRGMPTYY